MFSVVSLGESECTSTIDCLERLVFRITWTKCVDLYSTQKYSSVSQPHNVQKWSLHLFIKKCKSVSSRICASH